MEGARQPRTSGPASRARRPISRTKAPRLGWSRGAYDEKEAFVEATPNHHNRAGGNHWGETNSTADGFVCANLLCAAPLDVDHVVLITTVHVRQFCSVECIHEGQEARYDALLRSSWTGSVRR